MTQRVGALISFGICRKDDDPWIHKTGGNIVADVPALCALVPFHFVPLLLRFPLSKLPLSFLTLEKGLYLREQDTGHKPC